MLFKDSVQAANRYIYNHSVDGPSMNALQMMLFLEAVAMVTINPFAWEETVHRMFYFPQGALWRVKAYMYSETEI